MRQRLKTRKWNGLCMRYNCLSLVGKENRPRLRRRSSNLTSAPSTYPACGNCGSLSFSRGELGNITITRPLALSREQALEVGIASTYRRYLSDTSQLDQERGPTDRSSFLQPRADSSSSLLLHQPHPIPPHNPLPKQTSCQR